MIRTVPGTVMHMYQVVGFALFSLRGVSAIVTMMGDKRNCVYRPMLDSPDRPYENHAGCLTTTPPFRSKSIVLRMSSKRRENYEEQSLPQSVPLEEIFSSQLDLKDVPDDDFFLVGPKDAFADTAPLLLRPRAHHASHPYTSSSETISFACREPSPLFTSIDMDSQDGSDSEESTSFDMSSSFFSASLDLIEEEVVNELLRSHERQIPHHLVSNSLDDWSGCNESQARQSRLPRIRLKPRPASLLDGQCAWESMSIFAAR
jgi:hypothetical protein